MLETIFNQPKSSFLVVSYVQKHVNSAPSLNNPAYPLSTLPLPWQTNKIFIILVKNSISAYLQALSLFFPTCFSHFRGNPWQYLAYFDRQKVQKKVQIVLTCTSAFLSHLFVRCLIPIFRKIR